jgi:hypothetical protein
MHHSPITCNDGSIFESPLATHHPYGLSFVTFLNFREPPQGEVHRIHILGTWVNRGSHYARSGETSPSKKYWSRAPFRLRRG